MYIIQIDSFDNGARPSLQTWDSPVLPDGYAWCPDEFFDIFYSTSPAGFVNIAVEDNMVTSMTINQEALDAYIASLPKEEPEEDTTIDYDAILLDHDYRLLCLESGLTE